MEDANRCPGCGETRPADAPSGLCPACLLKAGMLGDGSRLPDLTITFGPASTSVLARFGEAFGKIPPVLLRDTDSITNPSPVIRPSSPEIPDPAERSARLQLFGEIARGGMGAVLKGRDADLGRDLAVKVLLESHREKPEMVRRFIEEAQIAGQLQHPGIVPIYELGAFGDHRPYFAMKLVKGHTLAEILDARKAPTDGLPRFLAIFESICQTMAYAHARGVIHRDLKPSNVMVGSFGEVQVMDWGLAKVLPRGGASDDASAGQTRDQGTIIATARTGADSQLSQAGSVMGTPSYMAPEQARGEIDQVDERADVFALGSIFAEILTGEPAFTGRNSGEIQRKAARGDLAGIFARLDQEGTGHDPELIALAQSCLAPEPDDRPRHAGEVADRMSLYHSMVQERLRQSEIARAEERARAEEATKRAAVERDRRRLTMALAASIVGMMMLGGGGWGYFARQKAIRQAATERIVTEALDKATLLRGQAKAAPVGDLSKWVEAMAAAKEARSSLAAGENSGKLQVSVAQLLATLEQEQGMALDRASESNRDHKFLERLQRIRLQRFEQGENWRSNLADTEYLTAFREFGIDIDKIPTSEAARILKERSNAPELVFFLDDWGLARLDSLTDHWGGEGVKNDSWRTPIAIAREADRDSWRNHLREFIGTNKSEEISKSASDNKTLELQPARSLLLLSRLLEAQNENDKAAKILERAWLLDPADFWINSQLAIIPQGWLLSGADQSKYVRFASSSVALRPQNAWAYHTLAQALLYNAFVDPKPLTVDGMPMRRLFVDGKPILDVDLVPAFSWEIDDKDGTPYAGPDRNFKRKFDQKKLDESIAAYRAAIRLQPKEVAHHLQIAKVLMQNEKTLNEGISEFQIAIRLDSDNGTIHNHFSLLLALNRRFDEAIPEVREAIRLNEKQFGHGVFCKADHIFLGSLLRTRGEREAAFTQFREAYLSEEIESSLNVINSFMKDLADLSRILSVYRDRLVKYPDDSFTASLLSDLGSKGTNNEVIVAFRDAIRLNPNVPNLHNWFARALKENGKRDEAKTEYDKSITLYHEIFKAASEKPGDRDKFAKILNDVGWMLASSPDVFFRDGREAVELATSGCELTEWKNPAYLDTLAAAYAESGDFDAAVKWQTKAIELLSDAKQKDDYGTRLKLYQEKKPYRMPGQ